MPRSLGSGIAEGIEAGFRMGTAADEMALRRRADQRATDESNARMARDRATERRQNVRDTIDMMDRQTNLLGDRQKEIVGLSTAAQTAGGAVDPTLAEEYGRNAETIAQIRQRGLDFFSRAQTGQLNPMDAPADELYTNLVAATGMSLGDLRKTPQHIANVTAGLETGNQGLLVQGVNGLMATQLRRGVGSESPHGGKITRKEIIGLDPAVDGNMQPMPGKFMPRLRVYVQTPQGEKYYDAPMTVDGSAEGDDKVAVIDVKNAMNWMGNLGTLATAITRPDVMAKLEQGEKTAGDKTKKYLDELTAISRPKTKGAAAEKLEMVSAYARKNNISEEDAAKRLQNMGVLPTMGALSQQIAAIDDLDVSDAEKTRLKRDVAVKAGGKTTGLIPTKGGAAKSGSSGALTSAALGGAPAPTKPDEAVEFWANAVLAGDKDWQVGLARSKTGSDLIEKVKRRVPELAKQYGISPADVGTTRAQHAALAATLKDLTKRNAAVDMFASKIDKDMATLDGLIDAASGPSPLLVNKPVNALRRQFSDPALAQLDLAAKQVALEYERLITGGSLSVAQLHAGAQEDAKKLLNGDMTPQQARAVMKTMQAEIKNAKEASHEAEANIRKQMSALGPTAQQRSASGLGGGAAPAGGVKYAEGQTATGPGGKKMIFKGGAWQPM